MIEEARAFDYPTNNAQVLALQGVVLLRQGEAGCAEATLAQAVEAAKALLDHNAHNYAALDTLGLAQAGLAGCAARNQVFWKNLVSEAVASYRAARAVTAAPGIVADALRLLDALAVVDEAGVLAPVRAAAAGDL